MGGALSLAQVGSEEGLWALPWTHLPGEGAARDSAHFFCSPLSVYQNLWWQEPQGGLWVTGIHVPKAPVNHTQVVTMMDKPMACQFLVLLVLAYSQPLKTQRDLPLQEEEQTAQRWLCSTSGSR